MRLFRIARAATRRWLAVAAGVIVLVLVAIGAPIFGAGPWWSNLLAELVGLLAGGVVLAVLLERWRERNQDLERETRWQAVLPLVMSRLLVGLDGIYITCAEATRDGATFDYWTPIGERLRRTKERLKARGRDNPAELVELIQQTYPALLKHVRALIDQLLPLAAELRPDDPLVEQLVALESAAEGWWALAYYSGRAGDADQWPAFRGALVGVVNAALPLAERVSADWGSSRVRPAGEASSSA